MIRPNALQEISGQYGRITSLDDLPPDAVVAGHIREAITLNEAGPAGRGAGVAAGKPQLPAPDDLARALGLNAAGRDGFARFTPSQRRDYIEWIGDAKTSATRERRLATMLEWVAQGKSRRWKYQKR